MQRVRFCYMPLGLFGTEVHAGVRPPWVALSKGLRLPLLRKHGRLRHQRTKPSTHRHFNGDKLKEAALYPNPNPFYISCGLTCVTALVSRQRGQPLVLLVAVQHQDFRLAVLAAITSAIRSGRWVERKQGLRLGRWHA